MTKGSEQRRRRRTASKNNKTKDRANSIIVTTNIDGDFSIFVNASTGGVSFENNVDYVRHEITYMRKKGGKIVNATPGNPLGETCFTHGENIKSFDVVVSVDTNYKSIGDAIVCITGVLVWKRGTDNYYICSCPFLFEISDPYVDIERLGWAYAIEYLIERSVISIEQRVAMIVDSHLSALEEINTRKLPIVEGLMLPRCYTLLYASADTGGDLLANKMLKAADRVSSDTLSRIATGEVPMNQASNGMPGMCRGFRMLRQLPA